MSQPPHPRPARARTRGLTLVEAALIVCIVGVVLAAFVPTFVRHLRTSKVAEAPQQLSRMHASIAAYYESVHEGRHGRNRLRCLPPAAGPTPREPSREARAIDFASADTPGHPTWRALGFRIERPIRYRYTFAPRQSGCALEGTEEEPVVVRLRAEGDLDGDGTLSTFERNAVDHGAGALEPEGVLYIEDRVE